MHTLYLKPFCLRLSVKINITVIRHYNARPVITFYPNMQQMLEKCFSNLFDCSINHDIFERIALMWFLKLCLVNLLSSFLLCEMNYFWLNFIILLKEILLLLNFIILLTEILLLLNFNILQKEIKTEIMNYLWLIGICLKYQKQRIYILAGVYGIKYIVTVGSWMYRASTFPYIGIYLDNMSI